MGLPWSSVQWVVFLFGSAVEYGSARTNATADDWLDYDREEYVMWGFSAHRERLALPANSESIDGEDLKARVIALMDTWDPALQRLVQIAETPTVSAFSVKTSVPIPAWKTGNVTLLGDALHNMTPFRGIGANTALWDAALLRRALVSADRGEDELIPALAAYERQMIDHGFQAVRTSLRDMERFHAEGIVARAFTKSLFRVIDRIPPLKAAMFASSRQ
jgi:2-polyprenyl-6-methoxyphenol hydroxylase-like FAD-dependent oxidoreductase